MAEFTVDPTAQIAIRQLSCVLLKQYVECHWTEFAEEKFRPPEVSDKVSCSSIVFVELGLINR